MSNPASDDESKQRQGSATDDSENLRARERDVPTQRTERTLGREVCLIVLSVGLSGIVAFFVAYYTARHQDQSQRIAARHQEQSQRIAARQNAIRSQLSAVYLPLDNAVAAVVACVAPSHCTERELLQAGRAFNKAYLAAQAAESTTVSNMSTRVQTDLSAVVLDRLNGRRATNAVLNRAGSDVAALQRQIVIELSKP